MRNVLRVLGRDIVRLFKAPAALVVVVALLVLPSVYTWYNVLGFWNPYENTANLRVDVVNLDEGGSSDLTGELHVGDMIVDELEENDQLDWRFTDYDGAMAELESGESYAVFVIPADFTESLLSLTTGSFTQPNLQYYVNEKLGPVAPKITDTGASTLDETINSTFVSTVSDVAVKAIDESIDESSAAAAEAQSQTLAELGGAVEAVGEAREALAGIAQATAQAQERAFGAQGALDEAAGKMQEASAELAAVSEKATGLQADLMSFSAGAFPQVSDAVQSLSQASSKASAAASAAAGNVEGAAANVQTALSQAQAVTDETQALADYLSKTAAALPDDDASKAALQAAAAELARSADQAQALVDDLSSANARVSEIAQGADAAAGPLDESIQSALSATGAFADELFATTLPAASESLGSLSVTAAQLSAALSNQQTTIAQAKAVIDELVSTLGAAAEAVGQTDGLLADLAQGLGTVRTDVTALGSSQVVGELFGQSDLDASRIAGFMGSPTEVRTEQLYPLNAYGSAMAPLFMNLTFWIGAFMLLVIMKQEVDAEGVRNLTLSQRYLGRFALFAMLAVLQAVICCAGVVAIGVQAVNVPALFLAAAVCSLAYLSIIYSLSVTLQHIGKGICIVLVFIQIPGATGLYPVEMTSAFFQAIYPLFPFTYGIGAMREAICGFYDGQYVHDLAVLAVFFAVFLALGLITRPLMSNVNHMVARQIKESGIYNGEDVEVPYRPYRVSQIMRALADKQEYREELTRRYERFRRWYPRLIRGSVVVGVAIPVAFVLVFALTPTEKVVLLTVCLVLFALLVIFLVIVESLRFSFERQLNLGAMDEESLRNLFAARNATRRADAEGERETGVAVDAQAAAGTTEAEAEGEADADAQAAATATATAEDEPAATAAVDAAKAETDADAQAEGGAHA